MGFLVFPHSIILTLIFLTYFPSALSAPSSIYDHLKQNDLPIGIFPKGIIDFSIEIESNRFWVSLTKPCYAKYESKLHYDFNVSGVLSSGKIDELSGMSQQDLFLWFPVKGIRVDEPSSGLIHFDVGVVDKQFSLSLFESPRDCTAADNDTPEELMFAQHPFEAFGNKNDKQEGMPKAAF